MDEYLEGVNRPTKKIRNKKPQPEKSSPPSQKQPVQLPVVQSNLTQDTFSYSAQKYDLKDDLISSPQKHGISSFKQAMDRIPYRSNIFEKKGNLQKSLNLRQGSQQQDDNGGEENKNEAYESQFFNSNGVSLNESPQITRNAQINQQKNQMLQNLKNSVAEERKQSVMAGQGGGANHDLSISMNSPSKQRLGQSFLALPNTSALPESPVKTLKSLIGVANVYQKTNTFIRKATTIDNKKKDDDGSPPKQKKQKDDNDQQQYEQMEREILEQEHKNTQQNEQKVLLDQQEKNTQNRESESDEDIVMPDDKVYMDEILDQQAKPQQGVLITLLVSILFITHFILEIKIESSQGMSAIINDQLIQRQYMLSGKYQSSQTTFFNIANIEQFEQTVQAMISILYTNEKHDPFSTVNVTNNKLVHEHNGTTPAVKDLIHAVLLGKYNYFMGMRITTKSAEQNTVTNQKIKGVFDKSRIINYENEGLQKLINQPTLNKHINQTLPNETYQTGGGYTSNGGFVKFFKGNMTLNESLETYQSMLSNGWFRNGMTLTVIELMFYNKNTQLGMINELQFFIRNTGQLQMFTTQNVFLPQNYNIIDATFIVKAIAYGGYAIGIFMLTVRTVYQIVKNIKLFCTTKTSNMRWYTYIDVVLITFSVSSSVYWAKLMVKKNTDFMLPLQNEADFQQMCNYAIQMRQYIRFSAVVIVLMCLRNLRIFTTQFQAFSVLFETLQKSYKDLIYFFFFVMFYAMIQMCIFIMIFGLHAKEFSTLTSACMNIFQLIFGVFHAKRLFGSTPTLGSFLVILQILFYAILVRNLFQAIVLKMYDNLRIQKQLTTQAIAHVHAKDKQKIQQQWKNFFCCKMKQSGKLEEDSDEEELPQVKQQNQNLKHKNKMKIYNNNEKPSFRAKLMFNINQVKHYAYGDGTLRTREKLEEEINLVKKNILITQRKIIRQRKEQFQGKSDRDSYRKLKFSVLYLLYIAVFISMIQQQTQNQTAQVSNTPIRVLLSQQRFNQTKKYYVPNQVSSIDQIPSSTFARINSSDNMLDFVTFALYEFIYGTRLDNSQVNYIVGARPLRFTMRFNNISLNDDTSTNKIFGGVHKDDAIHSFIQQKGGSEEITNNFVTNEQLIVMNYSQPGDVYSTFNGEGGYVYHFNSDKRLAKSQLQNIFYQEDWMFYGLSRLVADFVIFNPNYQKYIYNGIQFDIDTTGNVKGKIISSLDNSKFKRFTINLIIPEVQQMHKTTQLYGDRNHQIYKVKYCYTIGNNGQIDDFIDYSSALRAAYYDICFFVVMFAIITFGYAVAGTALYGGGNPSYSTIVQSFFKLLRLIQGGKYFEEMYKVDSLMAPLFYCTFMIIYVLAVINMFVAILVAHYNQYQRESADIKAFSFIQVVHSILKNNLFKREYQSDHILCFKKCECCYFGWIQQLLFKDHDTIEKEIIQEAEENHLKDAKNIIDKLQTRVQAPLFKDYKMAQGMRSYFQDTQDNLVTDNSNVSKQQKIIFNNVAIFKKMEYQVQQQEGQLNYELINANFWLYNLEENLMKLSNQKISIYDFQCDNTFFSNAQENLNPEILTQIQKELLMIDKNQIKQRLNLFKKDENNIIRIYDLWKALDFEKMIKILVDNDNDGAFKLIKYINGMMDEKELEQENSIPSLQFKTLVGSALFKEKFNKVTKMQHYIWTQIFSNQSRYLLWFEIFNSNDRVRLWNRLVFSENYFNFVANTSKYKREDIKYIMQRIQSKIKREIEKRKQQIADKLSKQRGKVVRVEELSEQESRRIRDMYYNTKVMHYVWDNLKKRKFIQPEKKRKRRSTKDGSPQINIEDDAFNNGEGKSCTMQKRDYIEMLKSIFVLMIRGLSNDRLKLIQNLKEKGGESIQLEIYEKLKEEVFDDSEYRLALWMPLTVEQKLDMIVHQRMENEMEIMIFLLEQELDTTNIFQTSEKIEIKLERAMDAQVFQKYMSLTRLQATRKSIEFCNERLDNIAKEDQSLIEYAVFMHKKYQEYEAMLKQHQNELEKKKKNNNKLTKQIFGIPDNEKINNNSGRKVNRKGTRSMTSKAFNQSDDLSSELLDSEDSYTSREQSDKTRSHKMMNQLKKNLKKQQNDFSLQDLDEQEEEQFKSDSSSLTNNNEQLSDSQEQGYEPNSDLNNKVRVTLNVNQIRIDDQDEDYEDQQQFEESKNSRNSSSSSEPYGQEANDAESISAGGLDTLRSEDQLYPTINTKKNLKQQSLQIDVHNNYALKKRKD